MAAGFFTVLCFDIDRVTRMISLDFSRRRCMPVRVQALVTRHVLHTDSAVCYCFTRGEFSDLTGFDLACKVLLVFDCDKAVGFRAAMTCGSLVGMRTAASLHV